MSVPADHFRPRAVSDHRAAGVLVIEWHDDTASTLPHGWLRRRCRCAACVQAARARMGAEPMTAGVALTDIRPISDQGLNLVFSDGHGRGIYPWAYLRALGDEHGGGGSEG